jgi:hypothetical protein
MWGAIDEQRYHQYEVEYERLIYKIGADNPQCVLPEGYLQNQGVTLG